MLIKGKALKYGDNIDTDVIIPGRYLGTLNSEELALHAMEGIDPQFPKKAREGVILVAGKNFGCGSSREEAPLALKYAGVKCVIAEFFARIFYRNSINIGLPVLECRGITKYVSSGDVLTVDIEKGVIKNESTRKVVQAKGLPSFILSIIQSGGLIPYLKSQFSKGLKTV